MAQGKNNSVSNNRRNSVTGSRKNRENRRKRESETEANNTNRNKDKPDTVVENNEDTGGFFLTQDIEENVDEGIENEAKDPEKDLSESVEDNSRAHPVEANTTTTVVKDVAEAHDNVNDEEYEEEEPKSFQTKDSTDSGIGEDIHPPPPAQRPVARNKSSRAKLGPRNKSEMRAGMQKEYFLGLEHLRKMITGKSDF